MLRNELINRYERIRGLTEQLCAPLEVEDYMIQSMPEASPARWHLAHTSWFFETFLLKPELKGYTTPNEIYNFLFNSYYNAVGKQHFRPHRGLISRPTVKQIYAYRQHVDHGIRQLLKTIPEDQLQALVPLLELGFNHEQQHQELLLTDIKHAFFQNPLYPVYAPQKQMDPPAATQDLTYHPFPGGQVEIGFAGSGFAYDNETPRHPALVQPFSLAHRLITNGEYLAFIEDGGYSQPHHWLSDGWALINSATWTAPLYWVKQEEQWFEFTLSGLLPLDPGAPVTHISYYEADAFASWSDARLPTEVEWELAAGNSAIAGNFVESELFHPAASNPTKGHKLTQMFGDAWEWTRSPYTPYPGFKAVSGAIGEYNGKFMSNQMALRGGSCVSSSDHLRASYRNFFHPHSRWQFMGLRLAKDA